MSEIKNNNDILLNSELVQAYYKKKTTQESVWHGVVTEEFKLYVDQNKETLTEFVKLVSEKMKAQQEALKSQQQQIIPQQNITPIVNNIPSLPAKVEIKSEKTKLILAGTTSGEKAISDASPTALTGDYSVWQKEIVDNQQRINNNEKRIKGIIVLLPGEVGSGKTHLACDMVNLPRIELNYRIIPSGAPCYVICTDPSPIDEIERNFKPHMWKDLFYMNCYTEDTKTGLIDPIATLQKMNKYISALKTLENGTCVIEDWTIYCALILYSYMKSSSGKEHKGMAFDDFLRPAKNIDIVEYQYKQALIDEVLLAFQNQFKIHFILVTNLKEETVKTGDGLYDLHKTGNMIPDMQKGTERKVDIVASIYKKAGANGTTLREIAITKSRWEPEIVDKAYSVITSPSATTLINQICKLYLQSNNK